jgi:hypothetical protein
VRQHLWTLAEVTDARLSEGDDSYVRRVHTLPEIRARLIELYETDPKVMPLLRVRERFKEGATAHVERSSLVDGKPSKRLRETLESSFGDCLHLVGAAYCEVFTCDGIAAGWLDDVREKRGFGRQRTIQGHAQGERGFVEDLMATCSM